MNLLRESSGWIKKCCIDGGAVRTSPTLQLIEFLEYPSNTQDFARVTLSDGEHYISAKITAKAIKTLAEKQDCKVTSIRGAFVSLRQWERVVSPSKSEYLLVVDDFMHQGGDGSTPYNRPTNVNADMAVKASLGLLQEQKNEEGDEANPMLLMASISEGSAPIPRTSFPNNLPFSMEDGVVPPDQRLALARVPGWKSDSFVEHAPLAQKPSQSSQGVDNGGGDDDDDDDEFEGSAELSSNPNGHYYFMDGVEVHQREEGSSNKKKQKTTTAVMADEESPAVAVSDDEDLPVFKAPTTSVAAMIESMSDELPVGSPRRWSQSKIADLAAAIRVLGTDWEAIALRIGSTPLECERFYEQYHPFLPDVQKAYQDFERGGAQQESQEVGAMEEQEEREEQSLVVVVAVGKAQEAQSSGSSSLKLPSSNEEAELVASVSLKPPDQDGEIDEMDLFDDENDASSSSSKRNHKRSLFDNSPLVSKRDPLNPNRRLLLLKKKPASVKRPLLLMRPSNVLAMEILMKKQRGGDEFDFIDD